MKLNWSPVFERYVPVWFFSTNFNIYCVVISTNKAASQARSSDTSSKVSVNVSHRSKFTSSSRLRLHNFKLYGHIANGWKLCNLRLVNGFHTYRRTWAKDRSCLARSSFRYSRSSRCSFLSRRRDTMSSLRLLFVPSTVLCIQTCKRVEEDLFEMSACTSFGICTLINLQLVFYGRRLVLKKLADSSYASKTAYEVWIFKEHGKNVHEVAEYSRTLVSNAKFIKIFFCVHSCGNYGELKMRVMGFSTTTFQIKNTTLYDVQILNHHFSNVLILKLEVVLTKSTKIFSDLEYLFHVVRKLMEFVNELSTAARIRYSQGESPGAEKWPRGQSFAQAAQSDFSVKSRILLGFCLANLRTRFL